MNSVNLIGYISRDLELKTTQSNISILNFNIAVKRQFTNADGDRETDFFNVVAFRKTAEIIVQFCKKGSQIGISGRLQQRSYEVEGQMRYVVEVVADNITFIGGKKEEEKEEKTPYDFEKTIDDDTSDLPF